MKALAGKRVMVTRPSHQSIGLQTSLEELGAEVIRVPVIEIAPPSDLTALHAAIKELPRYDWVVLTSVNGVEAVRRQMEALAVPREALTGRKLAAIGPATAKALENAFRAPDLMPSEYVSEAIAESMFNIRGLKFLLARADLARKDLADTLRSMGAEVDEVAAYRIVRCSSAALPDQMPHAITLTSAEIARSTYELLHKSGREDWMRQSHLICIGPITAAAVRDLGFEPAAVAEKYDAPGLLRALVDRLSQEVSHA